MSITPPATGYAASQTFPRFDIVARFAKIARIAVLSGPRVRKRTSVAARAGKLMAALQFSGRVAYGSRPGIKTG
jgi:hypothetical protein